MQKLRADADPIEFMTEIMDGFSEYVLRTEEAVTEGRRYRLNLLWVHSLYALLMGPAFMALGAQGMAAPQWVLIRQIPGAPVTIGMLLIVGGFVLGVGCINKDRHVESIGLIFLSAFYLLLCVGFTWGLGAWMFGYTHGPKPAPYAPILYAHLTTIMAIHFWTLRKMLRRGPLSDPR
jgi:hypothetical protein